MSHMLNSKIIIPKKNSIIAAIKMKTLFEILPASIDAENCTLVCELGTEGISCAVKSEEKNSFVGMANYHFDISRPQVGFSIALQILFHQKEWLSQRFKKASIFYSVAESVLIPFSLYDSTKNNEVLNLVHGDLQNSSTVLADVITEQEIYNVFRVPTAVYNAIQSQFPNITSSHQYSALLKQKMSDKNKLSVIFYSQKMVVSLFKNGKFHLFNCFNYRTPEDVSYTLLNICQQFETPDIDLEISGLLEKDSGLFQEVYKYFTNITFASLSPDCIYSDAILQYPPHYFSHIFALDTCE